MVTKNVALSQSDRKNVSCSYCFLSTGSPVEQQLHSTIPRIAITLVAPCVDLKTQLYYKGGILEAVPVSDNRYRDSFAT